MNKHHSTLEDSSGDRDNFEMINGIGESIAKALHRSGIRRFSELALLTPEELAERVKEVVPIAPAQRIENDDWIGQARELAKKKLRPITPKLLPSGRRELANFLVIFEDVTNEAGKAALQTIVNHEQSNQSKSWDGIATESLIQWMLANASLPGQPVAKVLEPKSETHGFLMSDAELEEEIELSLTDLWVSQATIPVQVEGLTAQKFVRVEGKLNIGGPDALSLTYERAPFSIEFYLVKLESNHSDLVTTFTSQLDPNNLIYAFQQDFPIPEHGHYRLYLTSRLLHPFTAEAQIQGPILRVGV
jgi:hypothetical protein